MPMLTPKGIAMILATNMMSALPIIALAMPPPASPTGLGKLTRKLQLIAEIPSLKIQ